MKDIRILIIDDEGYDNKCLKLRQFLKENNIDYDIALNLEDAIGKMFSNKNKDYDAIVLDKHFPEKEGKKADGKAIVKFLQILEEQKIEISVIVYAICFENLNNPYIKKYMMTWNPDMFKDFLETSTKWKKE